MGERYLFILILIFLVACGPAALKAVPTSQYQPPVEAEQKETLSDTCETITCPSGQTCSEGKCTCPTGQKSCEKECVNEESCCTDKDCEAGFCDEGTCKVPEKCGYGESFKNGECECAKDRVYCKEQDKCLERGDCCIHGQCKAFERCVETDWKTSLCAQVDRKKVCKIIADRGKAELFEIFGNEFRAYALKFLEDGSVEFNISNQSTIISENQTIKYSNVTLFQEGIETTGGFCKEDED